MKPERKRDVHESAGRAVMLVPFLQTPPPWQVLSPRKLAKLVFKAQNPFPGLSKVRPSKVAEPDCYRPDQEQEEEEADQDKLGPPKRPRKKIDSNEVGPGAGC